MIYGVLACFSPNGSVSACLEPLRALQVGAGRSRWLQAEDEVQLPWPSLEDLALKLLEELTMWNHPLANPHGSHVFSGHFQQEDRLPKLFLGGMT